MKLSIAMATYNGGRYLSRQLKSFTDQDRLPDELIVSDDRSSDNTLAILHEFSRTAPFPVDIQVNAERLGPTLNFDRALSRATGDIVLLSDQDDVWYGTKLAAIEALADSNPDVGCFIFDAMLVDKNLQPGTWTKMEQIALAGLPPTAMVMGCCAAFRRDLLSILLPIPPSVPAHDNWLVQVADLLGQSMRLPEVHQSYRRHESNVSDFFVNRLDRPGLPTRLATGALEYIRRATTGGGLFEEYQFLGAAISRMEDRRVEISRLLGPDSGCIVQGVHARQALLDRRLKVRALPRIRRIPVLLAMWRAGDYQGPTASRMLKDFLVTDQCRANRA